MLLGLRDDFHVGGLTGGGVEDSETFEQATVRETQEETGYVVEIVRAVGDFHQPQEDSVQHAYVGRIVGGEPAQHNWRTVELRWFAPDALPRLLALAVKHMVQDAVANLA